jgi:integrase
MIRRQRTRKDGSVWVAYYYRPEGTQQAIPLGQDLLIAKAKWAALEGVQHTPGTLADLRDRHVKGPGRDTDPSTQRSRDTYWKSIGPVFGHMPADAITPGMCRQYFDRRSHKHAARHELLYISAIFNWARSRDYLPPAAVNPMSGILRELRPPGGTGGRKRYVEDDEVQAVRKVAHPILQDYIDLIYLTGQRPGTVAALKWSDCRDGCLHFRPRKTLKTTGVAIRVAIDDQIQAVLDHCRTRDVVGLHVLVDPKGQPLKRHGWIRDRFDDARSATGADWWLVDLRAKNASDTENMDLARKRLGHSTEQTTRRYVRTRKGDVVPPVDVRKQKPSGKETG